MKYKGGNLQFTFFWDGPFSQWFPCNFEIDGQTYTCAEQYMMAEKARIFDDGVKRWNVIKVYGDVNSPKGASIVEGEDGVLMSCEENIMAYDSPRLQKWLGRQITNFDNERWMEELDDEFGKPLAWRIVYKGNEAKFSQDKYLKEYLLSTEGTEIVEASPYDTIWGIGLSEDDPEAIDPSKWKGTNWLGDVLTTLRDNWIRDGI